METRTVHINDPLAEGLCWHLQVGQRVRVPNSDFEATVVDAWTEGEYPEVGNLMAVSGAEVFYTLRTDLQLGSSFLLRSCTVSKDTPPATFFVESLIVANFREKTSFDNSVGMAQGCSQWVDILRKALLRGIRMLELCLRQFPFNNTVVLAQV